MSKYGYLRSVSGSPLDFEITRVDCSRLSKKLSYYPCTRVIIVYGNTPYLDIAPDKKAFQVNIFISSP